MSLYKKVKDFKYAIDDYFNSNVDNLNYDMEDFFNLYRSLQLSLEGTDLISNIGFLNNACDLDAVLTYYSQFGSNWDLNPIDYFNNDIVPILKYLYEQDYEVIISKIEPQDNLKSFSSNIFDKFVELEEALYAGKRQRVLTLSSSLLQSVFKTMLNNINELDALGDNPTFTKLSNTVAEHYNLKAKAIDHESPEAALKRNKFISAYNKIYQGINEARNIYSDSHGTIDEHNKFLDSLPKHHLKFIVDSTKSIVNFLTNSAEYQRNKVSV